MSGSTDRMNRRVQKAQDTMDHDEKFRREEGIWSEDDIWNAIETPRNVVLALTDRTTSELGMAILAALLEDGHFNITIFTRRESDTGTLPNDNRVRVIKADYEDLNAVSLWLQSVDAEVLISTVTDGESALQVLIEAATTAGVKHFIPSYFCSYIAEETLTP